MTEQENEQPTTVLELLEKIERKVGDQECIFRGEPNYKFSSISSGLYRKLDESNIVPMERVTAEEIECFAEELNKQLTEYVEGSSSQLPRKDDFLKTIKKILSNVAGDEPILEQDRKSMLKDLQQDYARDAKRRAGSVRSEVEILAEIQHYGGETNLIDFSESLLTALFFACYDDSYGKNDGRLIALPKRDIVEIPSGGPIPEGSRCIVRPLPDNRRALVQHSVMLHEPNGYLEYTDERIISEWIPSNLKKPILNYLAEFCDVSAETIFPDIQGYIESQKFTRMARLYEVRALTQLGKGKLEEALSNWDSAIELDSKKASWYQFRARTYAAFSRFEEALEDCNRALGLSPPQSDIFRATLYDSRARALTGLCRYDEALSDCNRGLGLCGQNATVCATLYSARAEAYLGQKDYEEALKDCNRALEQGGRSEKLYVALYQTRARVYESLGRYEEALKDCDYALEQNRGDPLFRMGIHLLQVSIYIRWNKRDKVEVNLKKALKLAKKHAPTNWSEQIQQELDKLNNPNP